MYNVHCIYMYMYRLQNVFAAVRSKVKNSVISLLACSPNRESTHMYNAKDCSQLALGLGLRDRTVTVLYKRCSYYKFNKHLSTV